MNFLPYHFLLVTGSENGFLSWLDISTGELVTSFRMNHANNRFTCLEQNPANAIIHTGHPNGTVALWSPNQKQPLAQMLAHKSSVRGLTISDDGHYMVTTCVDRTFNVTDLRTFKILFEYRVRAVPTHVSFSQRNMLALSIGDVVEVYRDVTKEPATEPYLRHRLSSHVEDVSFVNYEDVLGVSHAKGISSLLIPGSGEPNFDAFESNPFMTTSQKREMEVKNLLDKIPANLISLDPMELGKVDMEGLNREMEMKERLLYVKTPKIQLDRNKGRKKTRKAITQQQLRDEATQHRVRQIRELEKADDTTERQEPPVVKDIYSRFQSKF
jgi:U3 small nucleolar RNA-associated protein 7